jgi:hypothetical protein
MESLRITTSKGLTEDRTNYFDVVTEIAVMLRLVTITELMDQYRQRMNTFDTIQTPEAVKRARAQAQRSLLTFIMERATPTWSSDWSAHEHSVYHGWQRVDALARTISAMGEGSPARGVLIRRLSEVYGELRIECA